jgi:hypothetical protein
VHTIAATKHVDGVQAAGATMPPADKADSLSKVAELRRERIQNGGASMGRSLVHADAKQGMDLLALVTATQA